MSVVTRFAPSPTGFLHIGGARTALFNWLFTRHHGGAFCLRIEDTDRARSTEEATAAILDGLEWLGLGWDGEVVHQFSRAPRHAEVAHQLLAEGKAYRCYCTPEELTAMREAARTEGRPMRYDGRWRDRDPAEAPMGVDPVIRIKMPREGETAIRDLVQGEVRVPNDQLDDMILLRADGTPTYMLSVVVDDHDMAITHVIRGDDHLTNAFRQLQVFAAMDWPIPEFAHIPLIHGPDGAKLSKRHGALGVDSYREMGYLPEALRNYLLRLGWGHGDDEIIDTEQAVRWFDLDGVGKSAARFDFAKLDNLNKHYVQRAEDERLVALVLQRLTADGAAAPGETALARLRAGMAGLKQRATTLSDLTESARMYTAPRPIECDEKAAKLLDDAARSRLAGLATALEKIKSWDEDAIEAGIRTHAEAADIKLGQLAQPLRAALTGRAVSPGIFEVMAVLGREECLARINDVQAAGP
ncbi:MAG: glutamate--tRNA ligase [Rhodospirillaceae bacterium]|jgi:glutamyl-tRNA synthetase|nr:glutamate--tRNA ligase [Rhodospirillaceae bacterium]